MRLILETEETENSGALFCISVGTDLIFEHLTAVQSHLLVGLMLEDTTLLGRAGRQWPSWAVKRRRRLPPFAAARERFLLLRSEWPHLSAQRLRAWATNSIRDGKQVLRLRAWSARHD